MSKSLSSTSPGGGGAYQPLPQSSSSASSVKSLEDTLEDGDNISDYEDGDRLKWAQLGGSKDHSASRRTRLRVAVSLAAILFLALSWQVGTSVLDRRRVDEVANVGAEVVQEVEVTKEIPVVEPTVDPLPVSSAPAASQEEEQEEIQAVEVTEQKARAPTFNLDHCRGQTSAPCRFLLPGHIGGQESRGQEHMYRLGMLALATDRILVLPNVAHSEFGSCLERPFTFFYDARTLNKFGISTVPLAEFEAYTQSQPSPLSGQNFYLQRQGDAPLPFPTDENATPPVVEVGKTVEIGAKSLLKISCLSRMRVDYSKFDHVAFYGRFMDSQRSGTLLVEAIVRTVQAGTGATLQSSPSSSNLFATPDVLTIPLMVPFWTNTAGRLGVDFSVIAALNPDALRPQLNFTLFDYAPAWKAATDSIVKHLEPFVAIHWRTEQLPTKVFAPCTDALLRTLEDLKRESPELKNVYVLTDYPLESLRQHKGEVVPHSGSYKRISVEAHKGMKKMVDWFNRKKNGLKLTTWTQEESVLKFGPTTTEVLPEGTRMKDLDLSLVGMLDKSVAMRAQIFLAGSQGECGKRSSYTGSVIRGRNATRAATADNEIWNSIRYFGLGGAGRHRVGV
ncbi:hypothetical protein T439DRAFT_327213 [Meredithblackwellia eburnea MCA 4105]